MTKSKSSVTRSLVHDGSNAVEKMRRWFLSYNSQDLGLMLSLEAALRNKVAYTTTMSAANAACDAILALRSRKPSVKPLQEWQRELGVVA